MINDFHKFTEVIYLPLKQVFELPAYKAAIKGIFKDLKNGTWYLLA